MKSAHLITPLAHTQISLSPDLPISNFFPNLKEEKQPTNQKNSPPKKPTNPPTKNSQNQKTSQKNHPNQKTPNKLTKSQNKIFH